ncbi:MAG: phosphotransferase [Candidatus Latescibacteria bacterium]|nr:phosphotransferase [Candidatus Latescibacterota bacterium]
MLAEYRRRATAGLKLYGLQEARTEFLSDSDNIVFRVDTGTERFALRLQKPGRLDQGQILVELEWLRRLRQDQGLEVPEPVAGRDGRLLQEVHLAGEEVYPCALFRWVEGECRELALEANEVAQVGALIARLHEHAALFTRHLRPNRRSYVGDPESWIDRPGTGAEAAYDGAELALLADVARWVCRQIPALDKGAESFGLIHSDLHPWNLLVHNGQVRAIDFYDCGWGYHLHDMAIFLVNLNICDRPDFPALQSLFLKAYAQVRPLPPDTGKHLDVFVARATLQLLKWILEWPRPDVLPFGQGYLKTGVGQLRRLRL